MVLISLDWEYSPRVVLSGDGVACDGAVGSGTHHEEGNRAERRGEHGEVAKTL